VEAEILGTIYRAGRASRGVEEGRWWWPVELHQHVSYSKGRRRRGRLMRGNEEEATAHRLGAREAKGRRCMAAATEKGGAGAAPEEGDWEVGLESGQKASCRKRIEDRKTSRAGSWAEWLWAGQRKREIALQILLSRFST
jgi:hypothetical protein